MYSFPNFELVHHSMSDSNCCFLICIQISQEAGQVVWYSHLFKNFPQSIVIHTVKGFGIVNKAETDVHLELSCFFDDPADVGNLICCSSAFSKSSLTSGSSWFTYCWSLTWRILSITLLAYVCIHTALYVCMCIRYVHIHCCCSLPQSCPNICNPMDCSTPDFPLLQSPRACSSPCSLSQ